MTCSSTTSAAGRSPATASTPRPLEENAQRFAAKWGRTRAGGRRVASRASDPAGIAEQTPDRSPDEDRPSRQSDRAIAASAIGEPGTAPVSLTMIVRDEEKNLPHCLESVRGIFDEIVVVDTGSTDRTREIAREFGAKVFDFAWVDDFAAARNVALAHATGDYAFWLDADDVIEPPEREKLMALLDAPAAASDRGRLRRALRLRSQRRRQRRPDRRRSHPAVPAPRTMSAGRYRVHEQILPALRRADIPVRWTDLIVRHTGYTDPALRARKLERDDAHPPGRAERPAR